MLFKRLTGPVSGRFLPQSPALLPRHIAWRRQYNIRRYARHLSQTELNRRIRDIFLNLLEVAPDGRIGGGPVTDDRAIWLEKWTHVLEEMQLRHGPYPAGFTRDILHSEPFPNLLADLVERAAKRISPIQIEPGTAFIKFGKREHMERLYATGALRIQPASHFADRSHNGAVRDNELEFRMSLPLNRDDIVKVVRNPQDVPLDAPDQRIDAAFTSPTDYWLYCLTSSLQPRLFIDFVVDSCVIIRDRKKFTSMLREASRTLGAAMYGGEVVYIDPILPTTGKILVPLAKHFGYAYQKEYRFFWIPPRPVEGLAHFDVEIGDLREFSDLVVL